MYGRYPWQAVVNDLEAAATGFADVTKKDRHRSFHRIGEVLESLKSQGKVKTVNPAKIDESDVASFLDWCANGLDASTSRKYLRHLNEVLAFSGNGVIGRMRTKRVARFPKPAKKPIYAHSERTVQDLIGACERLEDDWWGESAKAIIVLGAYSGLRSGEIRFANLADLDTVRWQIRVSHPKGLNRWASGDEISPIMPQAEPLLRDYLMARDVFLRELGLNPLDGPLFPFWNRCTTKNPKVGYWKDARWNDLQQALERASGIRFRWKDLRPTYAQAAKDRAVAIESVSKALRHTTTATTEAYYGRIRSEAAFEDLKRAFSAQVRDESIHR